MCGSVSGGGVCYSGDSVGSVAVYFCNDGYKLEGDSTRECLSSGLWNGTTPHCVQETEADGIAIECAHLHIIHYTLNAFQCAMLAVTVQQSLLVWCAVSCFSVLEFYWE